MTTEAYLGIDGGGSQTRCILVDSTGNCLAQATSGPSNLNQVPQNILRQRLEALIDTCRTQCDQTVQIKSACLGLAGCGTDENHQRTSRLFKTLSHLGSASIQLKTDAEIALAGAFLGQPGMILIAGTGSICFAIDHFAHLYRTGGEGPFLGDLGSGTWIARQAIGRAQAPEASILRKIVCDHFKIDPQLKINQIELFNKYSNSEISALCFPICAAYTAGSQCVAPIIQAAADALHNLVLENYQKSNVQKLAFAGSLLTQTTPVRSLLEQRLADNLPQIQIYPAELSPLQGAVLNAYRHIHPQPNPAFIEKLKATFSHAPVQSVREKI